MMFDAIQTVRSFNRAVTQRVGALDASFLDRGRPLGEARLLYEIGPHGSEVGALRARLALDSGYLSRLLRSLERQGLVRTRRGDGDGRGRFVELTPIGIAEQAEYDRRSDAFAQSLLSPLSTSQRDRLVAAMADVERLMRAAAVEIRREPPQSTVARQCLETYYAELAERFEGGFNEATGLPTEPEALVPPAGCFLVAWLDGAPIGCGALKRMAPGVGYIKRMWIAKPVRGLGLSRRLLGALEDEARGFEFRFVRLETNKVLKEAQHLYRTSGYTEVAPFNDEPYAHHWFEKEL
jgi:DNA-binding MarR family transcriptional regulator/GNAT superfamily N-acetyltransferase